MHRARRVQMGVGRRDREGDAALVCFGDVVAQGLRHRVEGQGPVREAADEGQSAHGLALFGADGAVGLGHGRSLRRPQGEGGLSVEAAERGAHASGAGKARACRHVGDRQVGVVEQAFGALDAPRQRDLPWRRAEMFGEQACQMTRRDAEAVRQAVDAALVERAGLDQGQGARDRRPRAVPGRAERRGLGPAAQAGAEAGALGRRRRRIERNVARERRAHPAHRPTIDPGRPHSDEQHAVVGGIAPKQGLVSSREVEHGSSYSGRIAARPDAQR